MAKEYELYQVIVQDEKGKLYNFMNIIFFCH